MNDSIRQAPTVVTVTLRALARFPERRAFVWDGGMLSYRATHDLIGRLQAAMAAAGLRKGQTAAFLSANSAITWCAGVAAQGLGLVITWLHPLGSLADHLDVIEDAEADALVIDPLTHAERGGDLANQSPRLTTVLTMGKASFGRDLMAAAKKIGAASPVDLASADDYGIINYTGGTTGKSKGAIRRHRALSNGTQAISADFEFPATPRYLAAAPITHVSGSKVLPTLVRGGEVHLLKGFEPEKFLATIEREKINTTLMVPTMIYVMLDHPQARQDRPVVARAAALRRLADVADAAGRGAGADRPGVQPALRPDRMLSGERAAQGRPRCAPPRAVRLLRLPARLGPRDPARCRRQRGQARRAWRDLRALQPHDGEVLEEAGADGRDLQERLAAHRRHRPRRRARLPLHRRSQQGHDRVGRLQHLPARGRGRDLVPSRRRHGRGDRRAAREVGRGRHRAGRRQAGREPCSPRR